MEQKKKANWFRIVISLLFIGYFSLYVLSTSGYYDGNIRRKVEFTSEQIERFESDVEAGKTVDINDYLEDQNKNYTNNVSSFGYSVSTNVDNFLNKGIKSFVKFLSRLLS